MCERYSLAAEAAEIKKRFEVEIPRTYHPTFNAAPTHQLFVITNESPEWLMPCFWGLMPVMQKSKSLSSKLINAPVESILEKPTHKSALQRKRCLIPADGFYLWHIAGKKTKIPYRVVPHNDQLFAFAGFWEQMEDEAGEVIHTFTIITCPANADLQPISTRMPVILNEENEKIWLDNSSTDEEHLAMLKPLKAGRLKHFTISPRINNTDIDEASLIRPTPAADQHGNFTLFN